ncbi:hypothetical protein D5400_09455 [Georhizobium profundi]|uniref:Uncharacterized protein n=1 Tax=Georhizobium profundi TaxID=2341112 RepID=A0A3S9B3L2_9HYPH|nr:hypothetical protein D5400_09455 [Georhizobium profundi]
MWSTGAIAVAIGLGSYDIFHRHLLSLRVSTPVKGDREADEEGAVVRLGHPWSSREQFWWKGVSDRSSESADL